MQRTKRLKFGDFYDTVFFPLRALFFPEAGGLGLSSLRDERMRSVAVLCKGKVLDVGCGPGNIFVKEYIGQDKGVGIDVFAYQGVENVVNDMSNIPYEDALFDTVTLIAVGGHIPKSKRQQEFREFARLLKPGGLLIMTEGEPVTQFLVHKWSKFYGRIKRQLDVDSLRGMEEDEEYCMPRKELVGYLNTDSFRLVKIKPFMWGLNYIFIAQKCAK